MDATDTGYGFSMNGIQPIGTITTGNRYFVKLNKSMNENNTRFNTLNFLSVIIILIFLYLLLYLYRCKEFACTFSVYVNYQTSQSY